MSATSDQPPVSSQKRTKRVKIDVACTVCRTRKVKCDGARPACGNCSKKARLRHSCTYTTPLPKRSRQDSPGSPEARIDSLGHRWPSGDATDIDPLSAHTLPNVAQPWIQQQQPSSSNPSPADTESNAANKSTGDYSGVGRPMVVAAHPGPSATDSMTTVIDEGTIPREYFGSSSAGSFTAQIKKVIDARMGTPRSHNPTGQSALQNGNALLPAKSSEAMAIGDANRVLPTRKQADHLLGFYWKYVDTLYPFLDRPKWSKAYRGIFEGTSIDVEEHVFLATLNIIFALCSQLVESQPAQQRDESSHVYFQRAQQLLPLNSWDFGSVEVVQYLLLASQYLQSTDHPHQTWMTVGSAIRIAQGLGLHLAETSSEHRDPHESELFRRVWYGCVLMDRMVSVTHGRPSMIPMVAATAVPLPSHSATFILTDADNCRTDASFFVKSVQLYGIIRRTVESLYDETYSRPRAGPDPNGDSSEESDRVDLSQVIQLDTCLTRWERKLPEPLKWNCSKPRDNLVHRQAIILHIRLLHARLLLLRPVLACFCLHYPADDSIDNLQARMLRECATLCVSTAQSMISTLMNYQSQDGTVGLLPAWWYRVYYVYTAATILIAAKLCPHVFHEEDLGHSWNQAMAILEAHASFGQSARRCIAALQIISKKIVQDGMTVDAEFASRTDCENGDVPDSLTGQTNHSEPYMMQDLSIGLDEFEDVAFPNFDLNKLSWLNDMHGTWELLNQG